MIKVMLQPLAAAEAHRTAFAIMALETLQAIVNDPRFDEKLKSAKYTGRRFVNDAEVTVDADNELVRQIIAGGKEHKTSPNGIIELQVAFYKSKNPWSSTMGYVSPPEPLIRTNTRFADPWQQKNDYLSLAAHWMHEWMHVAGFRHDDDGEADVSYSVGEFVLEVGRALAREMKFDPKFLAELGRGYEEALRQTDFHCPVFEDGVPEDYAHADDDAPPK